MTEFAKLTLNDVSEIAHALCCRTGAARIGDANALVTEEIRDGVLCLKELRARLCSLLADVDAALADLSEAEIELSHRQREILAWVALGKSNAEIATILGISPHTVDTHLRRAFERLDTTDRTVAAILGVQRGLIPFAA